MHVRAGKLITILPFSSLLHCLFYTFVSFQIDEDFLASYQASYGIDNQDTPSCTDESAKVYVYIVHKKYIFVSN